ncbi:MAG: adenylate/guanylate cyclase domain-containing protein [Bryobacteraceae bacterium]
MPEQALLRKLEDGSWLVSIPELPRRGILLKADGTTTPFFGALGKLVPELGWPIHREYFLGSTRQGRYQTYERGLAVWEQFEQGHDLGYPVANWEAIDQRARRCHALIAFFDLRGFTSWSSKAMPNEIQDLIEGFERSFQDAFKRPWCNKLFAKGTGDGFMVVSEAAWYELGADENGMVFQTGHAKAFCVACAETVKSAKPKMPETLAIGCGITTGEITQLYLLGRFDYIGPSVNDASKIQAMSYNELCIQDTVVDLLKKDQVNIEGWPLPGKNAVRVDVEELIAL